MNTYMRPISPNTIKYFILTVFFLHQCTSPSQKSLRAATPLPVWLDQVRAGMWPEARQWFERHRPKTTRQYFARARVWQESGRELTWVGQAYLQVCDSERGRAVSVNKYGRLTPKVKKRKKGAARGILCRLSLLRAAQYMEKKYRTDLARLTLAAIDYSITDPISQKAAQLRFRLEEKHLNLKSRLALLRHEPRTPLIRLREIQAYTDAGDYSTAGKKLRELLPKTRQTWLLRAAARAFGKAGESFWLKWPARSYEKAKIYRFLPYKVRVAWKQAGLTEAKWAPDCPREWLTDCGLFAIQRKEWKILRRLIEGLDQVGTDREKIARDWLGPILAKKRVTLAARIWPKLGGRERIRDNRRLWNRYIQYLELTGPSFEHFRELVLALKEKPGRTYYDDMMAYLLGHGSELEFGSENYWDLAVRTLPPHSLKGRLAWWRYQLLRRTDRDKEAAWWLDHFYEQSPGSFYNYYFWREQKKRSLPAPEKAWSQVNNRDTFMVWLARYGGKKDALNFLAQRKQSWHAYRPGSIQKLWKELAAMPQPGDKKFAGGLPEVVLDLYRLGEVGLATRFYKQYDKGRPGERDYHQRRYLLGRATGQRFISVWHLRQLLAESGLAEDIFSLPEVFLADLFPRPYHDWVRKFSRQYGISEAGIYGLMRQESAFREQAVSWANAKGLMQVIPSTGKWVAGALGLKNYNLKHPRDSIQIGSKFFSDMIRQQKGFLWASVAYNGGPGNLRKWKRRHYNGDFLLFLEKLPNKESRHYARLTYNNKRLYERLARLNPRLGL